MNTNLFDRTNKDIHGSEMQIRWRDQLGNVYRIQEMNTFHIQNSMKYLLRRAEEMHDYRTVVALEKVVFSNLDLSKDSDAMRVEHMFEHMHMKPKEWVRRMEIMYAFHHELIRRRRHMHEIRFEGRAIFEFPPS